MDLGQEKAAKVLADCESVFVISHIDADGICSAAIADIVLTRADITHSIAFVKQLDDTVLNRLPDAPLWFTDLGSSALDFLADRKAVVTDHHQIAGDWPPIEKGERSTLDAFESPTECHVVNPHLKGLDGGVEICGAGTTFLVGRAMDRQNEDLAHIAVVGAIGDLQDRRSGRLEGINRAILMMAINHGTIGIIEDLRYFGRETRPLTKFLQFAEDPKIPGIDGEDTAMRFLSGLDIPTTRDGHPLRWIDLDDYERQSVVERITQLVLIEKGEVPLSSILGEVYLLPEEDPGTPLREAKEFGTLLNSCGRYGFSSLGLDVLRGDRTDSYLRALDLQRNHRRNLMDALYQVRERLDRQGDLMFFVSPPSVKETIVGIVANMLLGRSDVPELPIFAFAEATDPFSEESMIVVGDAHVIEEAVRPDEEQEKLLKVSARGPRSLVDRGLDLGVVMRTATAEVGGFGGGHNIAAGGVVPAGTAETFMRAAEKVVEEQLGPGWARP